MKKNTANTKLQQKVMMEGLLVALLIATTRAATASPSMSRGPTTSATPSPSPYGTFSPTPTLLPTPSPTPQIQPTTSSQPTSSPAPAPSSSGNPNPNPNPCRVKVTQKPVDYMVKLARDDDKGSYMKMKVDGFSVKHVWAADYYTDIYTGRHFRGRMFSSVDPLLSSRCEQCSQHIDWPAVNYLLNHRPVGATKHDLQAAIWHLTGHAIDLDPVQFPYDTTMVRKMVIEAKVESDLYVPNAGDTIALLVSSCHNDSLFEEVPDHDAQSPPSPSADPTSSTCRPAQLVFFEYVIPKSACLPLSARAWKSPSPFEPDKTRRVFNDDAVSPDRPLSDSPF